MIDWYHDQSDDLLASFLNVYNPTGAEPVPNSGLIMDNANSSLTFTPGKTYRLRLINMSGFAKFYFSIDGHDMDIIEVDGVSWRFTSFINISLTNRAIGNTDRHGTHDGQQPLYHGCPACLCACYSQELDGLKLLHARRYGHRHVRYCAGWPEIQ